MSSVAAVPSTQELVLGRYRPMRPLGSGGSGSVWLALDQRTGLDVALKIIAREGKAAARAEREALAARRLRHDRCVRAYDVGHDSSHVYIAYEYVAGRTLREAIRAGAISDREGVEVAAQVLDALAHAHRAGIVHRDVKPANILVEDVDELSIRLLDFGLAQFDGADTLTAVGDVPGTLAYIAPERLAGSDASPQSDVWSVGVLLWETLTERHPFWGMPIQEVARAIQAGAPPLASERGGLPRRLVNAVDAALALDPAARPNAADLAAELRNALRRPDARPARRERSKPEEEALAPAQRHARRALPVALAIVATLLGATLLPFWPPVLVAALVAGAAIASWIDPRLGLAVALAAPVFPIGNVAEGAALLYAFFAIGWLVLSWRDARHGLLFVAGPLLATVGLLPIVPLVLQRAHGTWRRAAHGALAVLSTVLLAALAGRELPFTDAAVKSLGVEPLTPVAGAASDVWVWLAAHPVTSVAALLVAAASALLPWARRFSQFGVGAVGFVLVAASVFAGASVPSTLLALLIWGVAGFSDQLLRRAS
ncbi:MAG TPA: serine/threonine-protein kinase [Gaiellaceae bacterium]|nr:serine/threonine-protein kinase [Gaiellaceae bacterium]